MGDGPLRIGFLGLGDMGLPMARRIAAAGHELIVWNRSSDKAGRLAAEGVRVAETPSEVAGQAELVGLCLTSHVAVEEVVFGAGGLLGPPFSTIRAIADFSTGAVEAAQDFERRAAAYDVAWIDAPVSGGVPAAAAGRLAVFVGGERTAVERLGPLLEAVAARVTRMGGSGSGQATKICNQAMVATNILVMAETIAMARRAGVDTARLPEALTGGFADSALLQVFGPRMAEHRFEPRLGSIALMAKDAGLVSAFATRYGADTPILRVTEGIYAGIVNRDTPDLDDDISSLIRIYEDGIE